MVIAAAAVMRRFRVKNSISLLPLVQLIACVIAATRRSAKKPAEFPVILTVVIAGVARTTGLVRHVDVGCAKVQKNSERLSRSPDCDVSDILVVYEI